MSAKPAEVVVSWDLAFWKPAAPPSGEPVEVYHTLIEEGEPGGGLGGEDELHD